MSDFGKYFNIGVNLGMLDNFFQPGFGGCYCSPAIFNTYPKYPSFLNFDMGIFNCNTFNQGSFWNAPIFNAPIFSFNPPLFSIPSYNQTTQKAKKTNLSYNASENEKKYEPIIEKYAKMHNLDVNFVKAVIKQESRFNPNATSNAGAQGLMQLMPATAKQYHVSNPYNPEESIRGGVEFLSKLNKQYNGNKEMMLAAYNWGPGNLAKKGYEKRPAETRNYITKVMQYYNEYSANA